MIIFFNVLPGRGQKHRIQAVPVARSVHSTQLAQVVRPRHRNRARESRECPTLTPHLRPRPRRRRRRRRSRLDSRARSGDRRRHPFPAGGAAQPAAAEAARRQPLHRPRRPHLHQRRRPAPKPRRPRAPTLRVPMHPARPPRPPQLPPPRRLPPTQPRRPLRRRRPQRPLRRHRPQRPRSRRSQSLLLESRSGRPILTFSTSWARGRSGRCACAG